MCIRDRDRTANRCFHWHGNDDSWSYSLHFFDAGNAYTICLGESGNPWLRLRVILVAYHTCGSELGGKALLWACVGNDRNYANNRASIELGDSPAHFCTHHWTGSDHS